MPQGTSGPAVTAYLRDMGQPRNVLFIQTAFIGDAILASSLWESWHAEHPRDRLHVCVRQGNEGLFVNHPFLEGVYVWNKRGGLFNRSVKLIQLGKLLKSRNFDVVITPHRHASSGWLAWSSGARYRVGFDVHPLRRLFTHSVPHSFEQGLHEIERNHTLLAQWVAPSGLVRPRLYPNSEAQRGDQTAFAVMAPASQWATKQWPEEKWIEVCDSLHAIPIVLVGGAGDAQQLNRIALATHHPSVRVECGLSLLESAGLMAQAAWVLTNDSGPLHLASAVNAPTVAVFCSTSPSFGFGPLAAASEVVEAGVPLDCKPCGLHGHSACPLTHFACGRSLDADQVLSAIQRLRKSPAA